jgi:SAM-dependent methyltransferase
VESTGGTTAQRDRPPVEAGACLLCGRSDGRPRLAEAGYAGRECECGVIYIDPVPDPEQRPPTADAHLESYYSLPARLRFDWAHQFVGGGRFLDVGCGSGDLIAQALVHGYSAEAVEPNRACARLVRERFGVDVEESLIEDASPRPASADLIYHVDLLSHFPDPVRALQAMGARLRPGGVMCFEVGLFAGLDPRWYAWVGRPRFPAHLTFFSRRGLEQVLDRAGLEVVALRSFSIAPSTAISTMLRRLLPERFEAVPVADSSGADQPVTRGGPAHRAYARLHYVLRYRVGAVLRLPGPQTAFVAARLSAPEGSA